MVTAGPPPVRAQRRRPEDTAAGCRALAEADRTRAAGMANAQMRGSLERSAEQWSNRATLLDRLEGNFEARARARAKVRDHKEAERNDDGQGTGSIEQGKTQAEGQRRQGEKRARPRIKGLSQVPDRKEADAD